MKIKDGFELRPVGDEFVVITIGDATNDFNGMIKLNKTGVYIWQQLQNGIEMDDLTDSFMREFMINKETAEKDIRSFIDNLKQTKCFVE